MTCAVRVPGRAGRAAWVALAAAALLPVGVQAQDATFSGRILDATTDEPVAGAILTVVGPQRQVITDAQGRFTIVEAPGGLATLRVQAFGFQPLEVSVNVRPGMADLVLRVEPSPIVLEGLTVSGDARGDVGGFVRDATTEEPIAFADLTLTRAGVERVGRATDTDDRGMFTIDDIQVGMYLLRAERLGYVPQYVPVQHGLPPAPLDIRLAPDTALMRGLADMAERLDDRRRRQARSSFMFDETKLRLAPPSGMRHFFDLYSSLKPVFCSPREPRRDCFILRGVHTRPTVYIDGFPAIGGLDQLDSYNPGAFHSVEIFECEPPLLAQNRSALSGRPPVQIRAVINAYTYAHIESLGRRPRHQVPPCL